MQHIKYRQWINGRWHYWGFVIDAIGAGNLYFAAPITGKSSMEDVLKNSQQFTGFIDHEGIEIYAGDIIRKKNVGIGTIVFMDKATTNPEYGDLETLPCFLIKWGDSERCSFISKEDIDDERIEVIGNTHQNTIEEFLTR